MRKFLVTLAACLFGCTALPELVPAFSPLSIATAGPLETGTTNPADLPAMARLRMAQTWPAWRVETAVLRANGLSVAVTARNPAGTRKAFSVYVITRFERGRGTVYYVGNAVTQ